MYFLIGIYTYLCMRYVSLGLLFTKKYHSQPSSGCVCVCGVWGAHASVCVIWSLSCCGSSKAYPTYNVNF